MPLPTFPITWLTLLAALRARLGTRLTTYTFNDKRSFAGEFFGSLASFYRKRWSLWSVALFLAGFALFVGVKPGFADHP